LHEKLTGLLSSSKSRVIEITLRFVKNLLLNGILGPEFRVRDGILATVSDISLVAELAPHAPTDQALATRMTHLLLSPSTRISDACLQKVAESVARLPLCLDQLRTYKGAKDVLMRLVRDQFTRFESVAILILRTQLVTELESVHLLSAVASTTTADEDGMGASGVEIVRLICGLGEA
jgi:hypothetical protein